MVMAPAAERILLYDGLCPLCNGAVRFVLRRDRRGAVRFAPLQGETARAILGRHPALEGVDALVLVEVGQGSGMEKVFVRSEAVLRVASALGLPWRAASAARAIPRVLRDAAYDLLARTRHRAFGRNAACPAPDAAVAARFLP
jgi:predicted DCC family thiol-disulfide oxidoreductase YuxK